MHALCDDIENGCIFLSEQTILGKMLEQAREQTDHLKSFSTELVAQIATPLREDLPNTIREAMQQAMAPVVENIARGTSEGVETLVGSVSGQLTEGIQTSVLSMNKAIEEVRGSLETVADRLDRSAGRWAGIWMRPSGVSHARSILWKLRCRGRRGKPRGRSAKRRTPCFGK